jgi:phosphoserine phosphatase
MNVYDFDGTIYDGDSTIDFYLYSLKHHPKLLFYVPRQFWGIVQYKLGRIDKTLCKERFYSFLNGLDDVKKDVSNFWEQKEKKIKDWYFDNKQETDVIISSSPEFLLSDICNQLNVRLICSKVDCHTGKYIGVNCYGKEKVKRFQMAYGEEVQIEQFYSDSISDKPLAMMAQKSFLVTADSIQEWRI